MDTDPAAQPRPAPAVSVILPTCGRSQLLLECVASILDGEFADFEIIVVDQDRERGLGATLTQRFNADPRIVYVTLDETGASRARNLGIEHARGEILVFSDDDVEVDGGWLRAYVDAFHACRGEPVVVGGRLEPMWLSPKPRWLPEGREYLLGIYDKHDGFGLMPEPDQPIGANFAAHRKVVDRVGPFDERIGPAYSRKRGMIYGEDALFCIRARQAGYPVYHQAAARARHKMSARKLTRRYFLRRSYWEGVTLLTIMHLSGTMPAEQAGSVLRWHAREVGQGGRRLARTLLGWTRAARTGRQAMEIVSSLANSAGVIRAALKLRATGHLPW